MDNGKSSYCRFLNGDDEGMTELVRDYKDGLILYINSIIHNISLSEELTEDTFVKLAVKKPKYKDKYTFRSWLYAIARNTVKDHLRHKQRYSEVYIDDTTDDIKDLEDIEQEHIKNEDKIMLHRIIGDLTLQYRQVIVLVFFEGFSEDEAAIAMHKSKRQVQNLLYNAKRTLKTELEKRGYVYEKL